MSAATWNCSIVELAKAVNGQVLSEVAQQFQFVGTDTRQNLNGMLFIPLKGENFDAHDFVPKAVEQGASVILVHEWREEWKPLLARSTFIKVQDTLKGC